MLDLRAMQKWSKKQRVEAKKQGVEAKAEPEAEVDSLKSPPHKRTKQSEPGPSLFRAQFKGAGLLATKTVLVNSRLITCFADDSRFASRPRSASPARRGSRMTPRVHISARGTRKMQSRSGRH